MRTNRILSITLVLVAAGLGAGCSLKKKDDGAFFIPPAAATPTTPVVDAAPLTEQEAARAGLDSDTAAQASGDSLADFIADADGATLAPSPRVAAKTAAAAAAATSGSLEIDIDAASYLASHPMVVRGNGTSAPDLRMSWNREVTESSPVGTSTMVVASYEMAYLADCSNLVSIGGAGQGITIKQGSVLKAAVNTTVRTIGATKSYSSTIDFTGSVTEVVGPDGTVSRIENNQKWTITGTLTATGLTGRTVEVTGTTVTTRRNKRVELTYDLALNTNADGTISRSGTTTSKVESTTSAPVDDRSRVLIATPPPVVPTTTVEAAAASVAEAVQDKLLRGNTDYAGMSAQLAAAALQDPNNEAARFYKGLVDFLAWGDKNLIAKNGSMNPSGVAVGKLLADAGVTTNATSLNAFLKGATYTAPADGIPLPATTPNLGAIRTCLTSDLRVQLVKLDEVMGTISTGFQYDMQLDIAGDGVVDAGDATVVRRVDYGEVAALRAGLQLALAGIDLIEAQQLPGSLDLATIEPENASWDTTAGTEARAMALADSNPTLGTQMNPAALARAKARIRAGWHYYTFAANHLAGESANQAALGLLSYKDYQAESFTDTNGNGRWDAASLGIGPVTYSYQSWNGSSYTTVYSTYQGIVLVPAEPMNDLNGNGRCDPVGAVTQEAAFRIWGQRLITGLDGPLVIDTGADGSTLPANEQITINPKAFFDGIDLRSIYYNKAHGRFGVGAVTDLTDAMATIGGTVTKVGGRNLVPADAQSWLGYPVLATALTNGARTIDGSFGDWTGNETVLAVASNPPGAALAAQSGSLTATSDGTRLYLRSAAKGCDITIADGEGVQLFDTRSWRQTYMMWQSLRAAADWKVATAQPTLYTSLFYTWNQTNASYAGMSFATYITQTRATWVGWQAQFPSMASLYAPMIAALDVQAGVAIAGGGTAAITRPVTFDPNNSYALQDRVWLNVMSGGSIPMSFGTAGAVSVPDVQDLELSIPWSLLPAGRIVIKHTAYGAAVETVAPNAMVTTTNLGTVTAIIDR